MFGRRAAILCLMLVALVAILPGLISAHQNPPAPTPEGHLGGPAPLGPSDGFPADATPPPTPAATPTPAGSPIAGAAGVVECLVEPRPDEVLLELGRRAMAAGATPVPGPEPFDPATGEPAPPEITEEVTAAVRQALICAAAGDLQRYLALFTEEYIVREVYAPEPQPITAGEQPAEATPAAAGTPAAAPTAGVVVEDVRILRDGRVVARVTTGVPGEISYVLFVERDGRWLIDAIIPAAEAATPTP